MASYINLRGSFSHSRNNNRKTSPSPTPSSRRMDVITYRLGSEMVYVKKDPEFRNAVNFAIQAFPQLAGADPYSISLSVTTMVDNTHTKVRISPEAWGAVAPTLKQYEIVDVVLDTRSIGAVSRASKSDSDIPTSHTSPLEAPPNYPLMDDDYSLGNYTQSSQQLLTVPTEQPARPRSAMGSFAKKYF